MTLAELPEIQSLSARDKLQLVDELWLDVLHNIDSVEISESEKSILDQRWTRFSSNPESALSLDQFKDKVSELRQ